MLAVAIRRFFEERAIEPCRIVAAVSGGPDSVALLLALLELRGEGFSIACAHVNHHLRGADSNADEAFVRDLCSDNGVELRVADGTLDPEAIKHRGVEAAAREIRIQRLQQIRSDLGARFIATAHQKNDQAETVLMRLFRGGGLAGLRGIRPVRDDGVIRPLLAVSRSDVEQFLREKNVAARHDISNDDPRFFRNRIRAIFRQFEPSVIDSIAAIAGQARAQWSVIDEHLDRFEVEASDESTRFKQWPEESWLRQALLHRHIIRLDPDARDVSAVDLERIVAELPSIRRLSVTKHLELVRRDGDLILRHRTHAIPEFEYVITPDQTVFVPEIRTAVTLSRAVNRPPSTVNPSQQAFHVQDRTPVFTLRNRRNGDRFQPLGMHTDKKLKDFLIDRKIPVETRDSLPLLVWNDQIVWVGGVEVSERFKVTDPAAQLYEVRLERNGTSTEAEEGIQR